MKRIAEGFRQANRQLEEIASLGVENNRLGDKICAWLLAVTPLLQHYKGVYVEAAVCVLVLCLPYMGPQSEDPQAISRHEQATEEEIDLSPPVVIPEETELGEQMEDMVHSNTGLSPMEAKLFHLEMWAFVHGIAAMFATGFLDLPWELVSKMLTDSYQGLRKQYGMEG